MNAYRKKTLLAVDGSTQSLEVVRYASQVLPAQNMEILLFHVLSAVPEFFCDLGVEPEYHQSILNIHAWEGALRESMKTFMDDATQILTKAGFPQDAITIKIKVKDQGVARDIISEMDRGYQTVMLGRSGLNAFKGLILGSVATKMLERSAHVPICVVGGNPSPRKMIYAVDNSEGALNAVERIADLTGGSTYEATLLHVVRDLYIFQQTSDDLFNPDSETKWMDAARHRMSTVFQKAKRYLTGAGMAEQNVHTKIVKGMHSRAAAIMQEAERGEFGTIVVGRRGISKVHEFLMGRVSNKIIQVARRQAVWVVG